MFVDWVQQPMAVTVYPFTNSNQPVTQVWYFCPPDAESLGETTFGNSNIDSDKQTYVGIGQPLSWKYTNGFTPKSVDGQSYCGDITGFRNGFFYNPNAPITRRDAWGVSFCCSEDAPWTRNMTMGTGGISLGGTMHPSPQRIIFGYSGIALGSTATITASTLIVGSGGYLIGGDSFGDVYNETMDGGVMCGGSADVSEITPSLPTCGGCTGMPATWPLTLTGFGGTYSVFNGTWEMNYIDKTSGYCHWTYIDGTIQLYFDLGDGFNSVLSCFIGPPIDNNGITYNTGGPWSCGGTNTENFDFSTGSGTYPSTVDVTI